MGQVSGIPGQVELFLTPWSEGRVVGTLPQTAEPAVGVFAQG